METQIISWCTVPNQNVLLVGNKLQSGQMPSLFTSLSVSTMAKRGHLSSWSLQSNNLAQTVWLTCLRCMILQVNLDIPALKAASLTTVIKLSPRLPCCGFWCLETTWKHRSHRAHQADWWLIRDMGKASSKLLKDSALSWPGQFFWMDVDKSVFFGQRGRET